jgi:hypothetical protein
MINSTLPERKKKKEKKRIIEGGCELTLFVSWYIIVSKTFDDAKIIAHTGKT